jgi:hypothetical protein
MLYYIRYSAGYSILCVLSYVLRSAYRPTISRAYSYTPTYPTVQTIVHSDGTPSIPPQYRTGRSRPIVASEKAIEYIIHYCTQQQEGVGRRRERRC